MLGLLVLFALAVLVIVHATGLADWQLVGLAFLLGPAIAFLLLPWLRFDPLQSALFMDAGLVLVAAFLVQHTLPPQSEPIAA